MLNHTNRSAGNGVIRMLCAVLMSMCAGVVAVHAAPGSSVVLPPLTQTPTGEHHVGKVVWADLLTPDIEGAKRFYGAVFGWTFREVPGDPNYSLALLNGEPLAGLFQKMLPPGEAKQPTWQIFLAVRDVNAAEEAAVRLGGKVLSKSHNYPQRGHQAVLADPDGAVFGVLAATGGDPTDYLPEPGEWIWSSLLAKDPKGELEFYKQLFKYQVFDLGGEGDSATQHYILSSDDFARAGLNALPADAMRRQPHWLHFVRVTDAADTTRKAVAAGGRVLVEPRIDRHGEHLAVLADPSGAPFGVMEWSSTEIKKEPQ